MEAAVQGGNIPGQVGGPDGEDVLRGSRRSQGRQGRRDIFATVPGREDVQHLLVAGGEGVCVAGELIIFLRARVVIGVPFCPPAIGGDTRTRGVGPAYDSCKGVIAGAIVKGCAEDLRARQAPVRRDAQAERIARRIFIGEAGLVVETGGNAGVEVAVPIGSIGAAVRQAGVEKLDAAVGRDTALLGVKIGVEDMADIPTVDTVVYDVEDGIVYGVSGKTQARQLGQIGRQGSGDAARVAADVSGQNLVLYLVIFLG